MRYVVAHFGSDCPHCDGDDEYECFEVPDVRQLIPCEDLRSVSEAIRQAGGNSRDDWAVFELVGGRFERRAVVFGEDREALRTE